MDILSKISDWYTSKTKNPLEGIKQIPLIYLATMKISAWYLKRSLDKYQVKRIKTLNYCMKIAIGVSKFGFIPDSKWHDKDGNVVKLCARGAVLQGKIEGSLYHIESTIGEDGLWHVHLHAIIVGEYIPQAKLSKDWEYVNYQRINSLACSYALPQFT